MGRLIGLVVYFLFASLLVPGLRAGQEAGATSVPVWVLSALPSHEMGLWTPGRPLGGMPSCSAALHDSFFVIGPDGRKYPTWHPPIGLDPVTRSECAFGHEHGRNPRGSQLWKTNQIQRAYYFDANANGRMDAAEERWAGLPFGYANTQADVWFDRNGIKTQRHEDHVGHKVEWANDETDMATHSMSRTLDGGVWMGQLDESGVKRDTGMRCFFLAKVHQGTSTPDAFTHNLHEVMIFQDCRHRDDLMKCVDAHDLSSCSNHHPMNAQASLLFLHPFGASGGFTGFAPLCGTERRSDARDHVPMEHSAYSRAYPDGAGDREIPTRDCIERGFLVEAPTFSGNPYEAWSASPSVRTNNGHALVQGPDMLFDVNDPARYYYPETMKASRGYNVVHPELAGTNLGYVQDLCLEKLGSRRARHGLCDASTDYGTRSDIAWDDPRAAFRGINRGMYFKSVRVDNASGPTVWFTDPFGGNASKSAFPGAFRQEFSAGKIDYSSLIGGAPLDPRVAMRVHDDGRHTVHAPN